MPSNLLSAAPIVAPVSSSGTIVSLTVNVLVFSGVDSLPNSTYSNPVPSTLTLIK